MKAISLIVSIFVGFFAFAEMPDAPVIPSSPPANEIGRPGVEEPGSTIVRPTKEQLKSVKKPGTKKKKKKSPVGA